jgi:hypothetical protein
MIPLCFLYAPPVIIGEIVDRLHGQHSQLDRR